MRRLLLVFSFFLILLPVIQSSAQSTATYRKKWLFGMNWGGAWENADVRSRLGTGWGLTLEKEIIANNTSLFGFSLRGRYLHTWMWGREYTPFYGISNDNNLNGISNPSINYTSSGYVYRNFYTKTDEFSLEGLLILNRLRANSGFKIYGFGGIGATGYLSKINQLDGTGNMYDYSSVSTFTKSFTKRDLNELWDNSYETNGVAGQNRTSYVLSGAIGLGIGIKLSPNVYLGWEHKYTYTSTDNLDASNWKIDGTKSLKNDRYHYSNLFLTVAIGAGSAHSERTPRQTTYYPAPAADPKPLITLLYPYENPVYLQQCVADIKVSITNLSSVNQITVLKDGNVLSAAYYSFDQITEVLKINTPITGNTVFSIVAQNGAGKDTKYVYTNCSPVLTDPAPVGPVVSIVSSSSTNCIANVVASVKNVTDPKSIEVIMDGIILSSQQYNFNPYNGSVVVKAPFNQFTSITIRATSSGNSAVQTVNLSCTRDASANTQVAPVISIMTANIDKDNNQNCTARITASVSGVTSVNMISVTRNGIIVNPQNYTFDLNTRILTINNPVLGTNTFLIKASNALGSTTASATVECVAEVPRLPVIQLVQPSTPFYSSVTCREHIAVKVLEVTDIQNIDVQINGVAISKNLMRFDARTSLLTFDALITKQTKVIVSATNKDGTTTEQLILYCAPVFAPTIQIVSPATDPFVSALCQETVIAAVTDVEDINSIRVTLNGIVLTAGLSYDAATDKLTFPVSIAGRSEIVINAVGKGGSSSKSFIVICQPAPKPVITIISPTTSPYISSACAEQVSAQIQNIKSLEDVFVTLNGVPIANTVLSYNETTGVLAFPVQFTGTASVVIKAVNDNGVTLQTLAIQCKPVILPKPTINVISPVSINSISKTCRETVKIKVTNCASLSDISVLENGVPMRAELLNYVPATGVLTFEVSVAATSTIAVSAKNNGGTTSTTLTIQCKPTIMPSVSILQPIGSPVISSECIENVRAVVKNVTNLNQIEITYNGTSVNRGLLFYDTLTSTLTFSHAFRTNGDLIIKASNESGQDSKTISLVCQPVLLPELVIINPKQDPYTSENCKDTVVATVKNIESIDGITAFANNSPIAKNNIVFDKTAGLIKVVVAYATSTEVKLMVENAGGSVYKITHLTCNPVLQPVINLINPTTEVYASQTCQENILMNIVNITSNDQIQVKVNSVILDNALYTFVAATGILTIPVTFNTATKVEVLAINKTKKAVKTISLTCNKLALPTVVINTPAAETSIIGNCTTTIKATVTNVTAKDQLIITNNGQPLNTSAYSLTNGIVNFSINVSDKSVINITATNATGAASDDVTLICDVPQIIKGPIEKSCNISATPITTCTSCNDTIKITSGEIVVSTNRKVCVPGAFTGNVTMNGGQLVICGNAAIRTINFNSGDIIVTGTATFDNLNMNNSASAIRNYGTVKFSNITFNGRFENHGQTTVASDFNVNSNAVFINTGTLNATMNFNNNNFVCNSGTVIVGGNLKDNGSAEFTNSCKLSVGGQLHIDKTFNNSGTVRVGNLTFVNGSGRLNLGANSKWLTTDIVINGSIAGSSGSCALLQIKNDTRINSGASVSGKIDICDVNGIELQTGSLAGTVTTNCSCAINTSGACSTNEDLTAQITICHKPDGSSGNVQTITISKSILAAHLAHGDHVGACTDADIPAPVLQVPDQTPEPIPVTPPVVAPPVETPKPVVEEKITICHKPPGNPANVQTIEVARSALAAHLAHGDHVGACTDADIPVPVPQEPVEAPEPAPVTPPVVVPPVEAPKPVVEEKITICHKPPGNPANVQTIEIAQSILAAHLAHGDHVGACTDADIPAPMLQVPDQTPEPIPVTPPVVVPPVEAPKPVVEEKITICHKPPGNPANVQTIEVAQSALAAHLAHGDHVGACTDADIPVPVPQAPVEAPEPAPVTPPVVAPPVEAPKPVIEEKITICHKPPGNPANVQTIEVAQSALAAHLAHGDHVGECTDADVPVTTEPPVNTPVEEEMVTICHKPAGSSTVQTRTIKKSELSEHMAHGDHVGACTDADIPPVKKVEMVTVCHKKADGTSETLTVPQTDLQKHLMHGDRIGVCTPDEMNRR
jgi:hypothetical protein